MPIKVQQITEYKKNYDFFTFIIVITEKNYQYIQNKNGTEFKQSLK